MSKLGTDINEKAEMVTRDDAKLNVCSKQSKKTPPSFTRRFKALDKSTLDYDCQYLLHRHYCHRALNELSK